MVSTRSAFNFGSLTAGTAIRAITEPTALFDALPNKKPGYGYLRSVQATVLDAWYPRREERDLVIKTNTGGGKTIVGLLMLQSSLHEQAGPALYIAPDGHLADRVIEEAHALGLAVVADPESPKFLSGQAICVTYMQVFMNAMTRFGIVGSQTRQPIAIGTLVVDDAHAALTMAEETFRLNIPASHQAFEQLADLFEDDLKQQSLNAYLDIRDKDPGAVLRVPYWAWIDQQEEVHRILRPHRNSDAFKWSWPIIADLLPICEVAISSTSIEIKPPCPPVEKFPSFAEARRRIYMTATLADDGLLVTHFDANPESVEKSIFPESAADLGDRLVLAPHELNPGIGHDDVRALAQSVAQDWNVVVLVPSWRIAKEWEPVANLTVSKPDDISAAVEKLKTNPKFGLVVIVNRYDGIDLPDDACRLLVIDSLPFAYSNVERREAVALRNSEAMVARQLQRLEQGIGRAVRSRDDRCAVILMGSRLTQLVARVDVADKLSPATKAQMQLSRTVGGSLEGASVADIESVVRQVIEGDADFRTLSREALLGVTYLPARVDDTAVELRVAYNCARQGRYEDAANAAGRAVNAALAKGDTRLAGWIGETHASYLGQVDRVAAQRALDTAARNNSAVLAPIGGITYRHLEEVEDQALQASSFLKQTYESGAELVVGLSAVAADIEWDETKTDQAEDALASLGEHLGFTVQQPERDFKIGSDVLWSLGSHRYAVIEAKTGATANKMWKKDVNQLAGSVNWCQGEYGLDARVVPLAVHPSHLVEGSGTPPAGCRTVNRADLKALKKALKQFGRALAADEHYKDPVQVQAQLEMHSFTPDTFFEKYAHRTKREPK